MTHLLKMSESVTQLLKNGDILVSPPCTPQPSSSSSSKISPTVLLVIVIVAVIFFVSGILHLLVRFLVKRPSFSQPIGPRNNNHTNAEALQRQLQQLFRLHDSGLDQPLIDALPVFFYKDIMGLKEPFDCAVCLCKFSDDDKLRLLPLCSHAFHVSCIDTWLLSNSTCPLCRGSLLSHGLENQEFSLDYWRELSFGRSINSDYDHANNGHSFSYSHRKPSIMEENASERRVFSVRLGKFKSINNDHKTTKERKNLENSIIASSSSNSNRQLDARRCYSLGSYQYVLDDTNLEVPLSAEIGANSSNVGDIKLKKPDGKSGNSVVDCDVEGKKISRRSRGDSFSVSKIWLWSKKHKFPSSSENVVNSNGVNLPTNVVLPLSTRDRIPGQW